MTKTPTIEQDLAKQGVSRRQFLRYCGTLAAVLALPASATEVIAQALALAPRLPVIWLEFQDCTGDTESFLRAAPRPDPAVNGKQDPSLSSLVLDVLSIDYHETLMVAAGEQAEKSRADTIQAYKGQYICVVEGAIPTAYNGYSCIIGGRTALSIAQEVTRSALMTVAFGACAWDGGLAAAAPNPTAAKGVKDAVPGLANLVNIPGCPANVVNLVATIVYYLTYQKLPALDANRRPTFAYGRTVHNQCPRRERDEAAAFGDARHRAGGCLMSLGCRGPETYHNCPTVKWNGGTCWPVEAGHGCIGCTNPAFWDNMSPFYSWVMED
ncbi:MAG: twin-arginine translocation signal domain-containing protein [Chloroflexi bacterium]|nr:MAG: twin-arginine translocation signal domain-containing protein [Chloroflexota bacterium]